MDSGKTWTKIFNHAEKDSNYTFVRYADNKIYAISARESQLHILDMTLACVTIADHQFEGEVISMEAKSGHAAIGTASGTITVFNNIGDVILVNNFITNDKKFP